VGFLAFVTIKMGKFTHFSKALNYGTRVLARNVCGRCWELMHLYEIICLTLPAMATVFLLGLSPTISKIMVHFSVYNGGEVGFVGYRQRLMRAFLHGEK
jgi:hypothetical protein